MCAIWTIWVCVFELKKKKRKLKRNSSKGVYIDKQQILTEEEKNYYVIIWPLSVYIDNGKRLAVFFFFPMLRLIVSNSGTQLSLSITRAPFAHFLFPFQLFQ